MYNSGVANRLAGSPLNAVPQDRQNFLPGVLGAPQLGQSASSRAPQSSQKRAAGSFCAWHRGHFNAGTLRPVLPVRIGTVGPE